MQQREVEELVDVTISQAVNLMVRRVKWYDGLEALIHKITKEWKKKVGGLSEDLSGFDNPS